MGYAKRKLKEQIRKGNTQRIVPVTDRVTYTGLLKDAMQMSCKRAEECTTAGRTCVYSSLRSRIGLHLFFKKFRVDT